MNNSDRWHMTYDMWHVTCDTRHMTHDTGYGTCGEGGAFSSSYCLGLKAFGKFKRKGWIPQ